MLLPSTSTAETSVNVPVRLLTGVVQDQHQRRHCGKSEGEKCRKLAIRRAAINDDCSLKFDEQSVPQRLSSISNQSA